jgi:hypothetical protein
MKIVLPKGFAARLPRKEKMRGQASLRGGVKPATRRHCEEAEGRRSNPIFTEIASLTFGELAMTKAGRSLAMTKAGRSLAMTKAGRSLAMTKVGREWIPACLAARPLD